MGISVMYLMPYGHQCDVFNAESISTRKFSRMIALNTRVLVLLKSMKNASQISCFARQLYPNCIGMLEEIYEDSMKNPYGYLVVDMNPSSADLYRLRTHIFPEEYPPVIYIPKKVDEQPFKL